MTRIEDTPEVDVDFDITERALEDLVLQINATMPEHEEKVEVPRALLGLCLDVLEKADERDDRYNEDRALAIGQLKAVLIPPEYL